MQPKRSEVFENYIKIAQEKNLISNAESWTEDEKHKDSEYQENIKLLYNLKPKDKNIIDEAHPNKAVVFPSHDKFNGVVENLNERQDVMAYIALKTPTGNLTQSKYAGAYQDLVNELVKIGFVLDHKGSEELMNLADSCSERLTKSAFAWGAIAGWAVKILPVALGILAAKNHFVGSINQGIINNCQIATEKLRDISPSVDANSRTIINKYIQAIEYVQNTATEAQKVNTINISPAVQSKNVEDLLIASQTVSKEDQEFLQKYLHSCSTLLMHLPKLQNILDNVDVHQEREYEWWAAIKKVWEGVVGSDLDEAKNAIETLATSLSEQIEKITKDMDGAKKYVKNNENEILLAVQEKPKNTQNNETENVQENKPEQPKDEVEELTNQMWM